MVPHSNTQYGTGGNTGGVKGMVVGSLSAPPQCSKDKAYRTGNYLSSASGKVPLGQKVRRAALGVWRGLLSRKEKGRLVHKKGFECASLISCTWT